MAGRRLPPIDRSPIMWAFLNGLSDPLAWISVAGLLLAVAADMTDRRTLATRIGAVAWVAFGGFWLSMFPYYYFEFASPLESVLSLIAVPLCAYTGYLLYRGRDSLLLLSRAVAVMGIIYLPAMMYPPLTRWLIETVATQTHMGMELLGYSPGVEEGANGYQSRFAFAGYSTYIVLACTGIGSIAIFGGLIAASSAPLARKLVGVAMATGVIWILNLVRNVFVGLAAPLGWFDYPALATITGIFAGPGMRTSFFVAHHMISQTLAIVALVGIALLVIRIVPEVLAILDEALFVVTGSEWGLEDAMGKGSVRADGSGDR